METAKTYWNKTHAGLFAEFVHLPFFFPVQHTVVVLHAHEFCPTIFFCGSLHHRELVRPHTACTNLL